jgi:hypothetical protein
MVGVATSTLLRSAPATAFPSRAIWQTGEGGQWVGLRSEVVGLRGEVGIPGRMSESVEDGGGH